MKIRWISTIVLIVMFFAVTDISYCEDEQQCQPDAVVMFGNGVWNDAEDADESRRILEDALEIHVLGTELKGIIKYDVAHNPSEGALEDLLETFEQNFQTEKSKFWRFLAGLDLMPDFLQDKLKEIATEVNADIISANPSIQEHITKYDTYLSEGNVVVLVAHSQGNLYGNIAHLGLDQQYIAGFGIVSVANPDSYVAGGGPYTTIEEDYIISPLQFVYPFASRPNLNNFTGPVNLADWSGHKFIESYMAAGHSAETVILDNVVNMINKFSQPLSSGNTTAIFVAGPAGGGRGQYDWAVAFASLDPAKVNWVAWNDAPQVQLTRPSRPGEIFLGPGSYGLDDHIALTVIAPGGASQTANIDWNDALGVSSGTQNVIFGTAANAPDVFRQNPYFANPPNVEFFLDEGGSHNTIFSETGNYEFQFSFQSPYGNGSHSNIYLLIQCQ